MRTALVEAAMTMMANSRRNCSLKAWGLKVAKRRGMHKAAIAVARRLATILHRMWLDGTDFRWSEKEGVGMSFGKKEPPIAAERGWVCPKCGNVYSPRALACSHCNKPARDIIR